MPAWAALPVLRGVELAHHYPRGVLDHPPSRVMTVRLRQLLPQRLQDLHQFGVDEFVAADHAAGLERVVIAGDA